MNTINPFRNRNSFFARKQWCPWATIAVSYQRNGFFDFLVGTHTPAAVNRVASEDGRGDPACNCIASRCPAWRWHPRIPEESETVEEPDSDAFGYCVRLGRQDSGEVR